MRYASAAIPVVAVTMVLYHLMYTQFAVWGILEHQTIHLGFGLVLVFLSTMVNLKRQKLWPIFVALLLATLVVISYLVVRIDYLQGIMGFTPTWMVAAMGILLVVLVIESTRQAWGWVLPIVAIVSILYFLYGDKLPPPFEHAEFPSAHVLSLLGIGFSGIYGVILSTSATDMYLFVVFGGLIGALGAIKFFLRAGQMVGKVVAGGAAQTAVISSAMIGMLMGQAASNVALTGAFTIPMMKKTGYTPEEAGAVEASASTGGQIMPPIMGAAAFLMAAIMGISYVSVVLASFIPAFLYFLGVGLSVRIIALKRNLRSIPFETDTRELITGGVLFFVPLALVMFLLLMRFTPMFTAFYAILAALLLSLTRKGAFQDLRGLLRDVVNGFTDGAIVGAKLGVAAAMIGIVVIVITYTGIGVLLAQTVEMVSGGHLWIALTLTMLVSVFMGMGMPTPAAYLIVAVVIAPALIRMGAPPFASHLFAMWYASFSSLTPPVAFASMAGAAIAHGDFMKTSWKALHIVLPGLIVPYIWMYAPSLVLQPAGDGPNLLTITIICVMGLTVLTALINNYFFTYNKYWETVVLILSLLGMFSYIAIGNIIILIVSIVLALGIFYRQFRVSKARTAQAKLQQ